MASIMEVIKGQGRGHYAGLLAHLENIMFQGQEANLIAENSFQDFLDQGLTQTVSVLTTLSSLKAFWDSVAHTQKL
jgi:hypothetical protein